MGFIMTNRESFTWPVHPRRSYPPRMVGELAALAGIALPPWWTGAYYGRDTIGHDAEDFDADRALARSEECNDLLRDVNRDLEGDIGRARARLAEQRRAGTCSALREEDVEDLEAELRRALERAQRLEEQVRELVQQVGDARAREGHQAVEFMAVLAAVAGASRG